MKTNTADVLLKESRENKYKKKVAELTPSSHMLATVKRPREDVQRSFATVAAVKKLDDVKEEFQQSG